MIPRPDTLAGKVLGELQSEISGKLGRFTEAAPFESSVALPVAENGPFDYVVVGYRNKAERLRERLFTLRAAMVGHTATFELRPDDETDRALVLAPRQLAGGHPSRTRHNRNMEAVGLRLHTDIGTGVAYGDLNEEGRQSSGGVERLQAHFHLGNFVRSAQLDPSTERAVAAFDFAHTMVGHVVDLSRPTAPEQSQADIAGAA